MPSIPSYDTRIEAGFTANPCLQDEKPSIMCIASHAYRHRLGMTKELKYATSFQRTQDYIDSLRDEVEASVFKHSVANNTTPVYAFEEVTGLYHSDEHPLMHKGLLSFNKSEQRGVPTQPPKKVWSSNRPKPQSANRSFYRPNSTHNYLTKTIDLGGSHDGFNPNLGTPTRAQLLRNRIRFSSAPDLTYSYLAHKRMDGKHEAAYRKTKLDQEALQLKASKIEMDRTAAKYRQYMIGSQYNTAKWISSHISLVGGLVATRTRPASSVAPKTDSLKVDIKRRATSATARLRLNADWSANVTPPKDAAVEDLPADTAKPRLCPSPDPHGVACKAAIGIRASARTPNLIPYTASINSPGLQDHLVSSMIIKSAKEMRDGLESQKFAKKMEAAKRLASQIETSARPSAEADRSSGRATPHVTRAATPANSDQRGSRRGSAKATPAREPRAHQQLFVTNSAAELSVNEPTISKMLVKTKASSGDLTESGGNTISALAEPATASQRPPEDSKDDPTEPEKGVEIEATKTHSVSVELPGVDAFSDTLSASVEDVNAAMGTNKPVEIDTAVDVNAAMGTNKPVEIDTAVDINAAMGTNKPVEIDTAVDVNAIQDINAAEDLIATEDLNAAEDLNVTEEVNVAADVNVASVDDVVDTSYPDEARR